MIGDSDIKKSPPIPLDTILFLILGLVAGRLISDMNLAAFINNGGPILFPEYTIQALLTDLISVAGFLWVVLDRRLAAGAGDRRRFFVFLSLIMVVIMTLGAWRVLVRNNVTEPAEVTHDGIIQTEVAARMLLRGDDPYAANFRGSPLDDAYRGTVPDSNNLFTHYVYPPLLPIISIPVVWIADEITTAVELQFIFLAALVLAVAWLIAYAREWSDRLLILVLTLGNPLFYSYTIGGYNDALMIGPLVIGALCLIKRRWVMGGIALGLALAAKQTAWFFVPLFLLLLWSWWRSGDPVTRAGIKKNLFWLAATTAIFYLPFIIWNAPALFDDLVRFPSGIIPGSYPVGGSTVWQFWVLADPQHYYFPNVPSQALQAVVGGILLLLLGRRLWQNPKISNWLVLSTALVLAIGVVGRFMYGNYLSTLALLATAGFFMAQYVETD